MSPATDAPASTQRSRQPNGLAAFLVSPRWQTLVPCECPDCGTHLATLSAGGTPSPIRHAIRITRGGVKVWCRGLFVAVPRRTPAGPVVELVRCADQAEQDREVARRTAAWATGLVQEIARAGRPARAGGAAGGDHGEG